MTHHRERFVRVYAPAEAVAPLHLLAEAPDEEADASSYGSRWHSWASVGQTHRHAASSPVSHGRWRAPTRPRSNSASLTGRTHPRRGRGLRGPQFVSTEDLRIRSIEGGGVPAGWEQPNPAPRVALLSPLDPVSARGRAATSSASTTCGRSTCQPKRCSTGGTRSDPLGTPSRGTSRYEARAQNLHAGCQRHLDRGRHDGAR